MIFYNIFLLLQLIITTIVLQWIPPSLCIQIFIHTEHTQRCSDWKQVGCFVRKNKFCLNKSLSGNYIVNLVCNFGGKYNDHRFQLHYSVAETSHCHHQDPKPGPTLQVANPAFMIPNILGKRKIFPWPNRYNVCITLPGIRESDILEWNI